MNLNIDSDEEDIVGLGLLQDVEFTSLLEEEEDSSVESTHKPIFKGSYTFPINKEKADLIYTKAGENMNMSTSGIQIPYHVRDSMRIMIDECLSEMKLDISLNDMQVQALSAIGESQDTFVISPCGTGKSLVFFLSILLLRKIRNQPNGIGWILEPLVSISEDKRGKNPPLPIVYITKGGEYKTSENIEISEPIESVKLGSFPCIFISAEALLSSTGVGLMRQLRKILQTSRSRKPF